MYSSLFLPPALPLPPSFRLNRHPRPRASKPFQSLKLAHTQHSHPAQPKHPLSPSPAEIQLLRQSLASRRQIRRTGIAISFLLCIPALILHPLPLPPPLILLPLSVLCIAYRPELGHDGNLYLSRRAPFPRYIDHHLHQCIEVRESKGKGRGAFATRHIRKGTFLGVYDGVMMDNAEYMTRYPNGGEYGMTMDADVVRDGQVEDGVFGTAVMNHSKGRSANVLRVWRRRERQVLFYTRREVSSGEELCYDYGKAFWRGREDSELP